MQEKPLRKILSLLGGVTAAARVRIEWISVDFVKLAERYLETGCLTLGGEQYHAPPSRMKSVLIVPERDLVLLQLLALKALIITFILICSQTFRQQRPEKSFEVGVYPNF